jgi:hypothetical protein
VFGVVEVESSILLGFNEEVVCKFVVDIVELDVGEVVLRWFFVELVERALLAGYCRLLVFFEFAILGDGVFRVTVASNFSNCLPRLPRDFLIDDGVDIIGLFWGY